MQKPILFISNMNGDPWGGSEELWTRTANLLAKKGLPVAASVTGWPQLDRRISELSRIGVDVRPRPIKPSVIARARRYITGQAQIAFDIERSFGTSSPSLVMISNAFGVTMAPIEIIEVCVRRGWPFAILSHSSLPDWWPSDELAARLREVLPLARRCFFVSRANLTLAEKQVGYSFENAEVVSNPLVIEIDAPKTWPLDSVDQQLRMACVGRLSPEKGQDVLIEALANPRWANRPWHLAFYGNGPNRDVFERLVKKSNLQNKISFAGHVAPEKIWDENHILVMPSRQEGMPLTVIEAMFCGRPVVATMVGGMPEVVLEGITGFLAAAAVAECIDEALGRMWGQRDRLEEFGKRAATSIREFMPSDPIGIFANKILALATPNGKTKMPPSDAEHID
jgi:glycosyltransferase involved in cell wall biosynthesis